MILTSLAILLLAGFLYERAGAFRDRRRFPPPGRIVRVNISPGSRSKPLRLHVNEQGQGEPCVIFESGIAASSLSWTFVQPEVAKLTRTISYDRAGLGWSDPCRIPRTLHDILSELDALLRAAAIPGPYLLVGHSFGGLLIRAWAARHPDQVAGLVFVDPVSLTYWSHCSRHEERRLILGASFARRGKWLARFGVVRAALAALTGRGAALSRFIGKTTAREAMGTLERMTAEIRKLPPATWPIIRSHWSGSKCMAALGAYLRCLPQAAREASAMPLPRHIPFIILSAANATEAELAERNSWVQQSEAGRHEIVPGAGHWIPLECPNAIISAVEELLQGVRKNS
jgi:pimeloyl-ACP methyl ester carboxylesterase